ncbi:MAG TPA: DegT/DnrJ/EryC1/StrS family aminotransferase [Pyrinomonadaceae bacterium]|nr:DegT/DnrJ/EryC1/StrS family aminotransferase [Pyrinomonadaceae bacterium]
MNDQPALLGNEPIFAERLPIAKPTLPQLEEIAAELTDILESGILSKGSRRLAFEEAVSDLLGVEHAIAVSSCTAGLMLTYQALGLSGAEVVVPSFTFMATVSALRWIGARPIFADVNAGTTNLDPADAEAAITKNTRAIVAVHNSGNPAAIADLQRVADNHNLRLVFDAAHAFGASYQGRAIGPQGVAQVFSLSPTKLVVAGEGGIVVTNDGQVAEHVRIGREYGNCGEYDSSFPGLNARLTEINALLGQHSLRRLEWGVERRNHLAALYRKRLGRLPGIGFLKVDEGNRCSYKDFSITIDPIAFGLARDELGSALEAENIETRTYYDPPVHRQLAYRSFTSTPARLRNTDLLSTTILNLPMWSHMDDEVVFGVCSAVERAHESADSIKAAFQRAATV